MSVINSMLRDLDRRHAPLPMNANVQASPIANSRTWPRAVFALCALFIFIAAMWSWNHHTQKNVASLTKSIQSQKNEVVPANGHSTLSSATTRRESIHGGSEAASMPPTVAADDKADRPTTVPASNIENKLDDKNKKSSSVLATQINSEKLSINAEPANQSALRVEDTQIQTAKISAVAERPAPILKQERKAPEDLNAERYQLARAALAQNQPQRAYELLRDSPPPVASDTDYHAVLAAVEQQLGHYADASLRYQQLLLLDQNQASWWLGLALSLEGEHRSGDALAAYRRTAALNALPDAARQYVTARIAALGSSTAQKVEAEH